MRKISNKVNIAFGFLFTAIIGCSLGLAYLIGESTFSDRMYNLGVLLSSIILFYTFSFATYQIFLKLATLENGYIEKNSKKEFWANLNILFYLLIFNSIIRNNFLTVPAMRLVYLALGTKMGGNGYRAGAILDPALTSIRHDPLVDYNLVVLSHVNEGDQFSFERVHIGLHQRF